MVGTGALWVKHVLRPHPAVGAAVVALNDGGRRADTPSTYGEHDVVWNARLSEFWSWHLFLDELEPIAVTIEAVHRVDDRVALNVLADDRILGDVLGEKRFVHDAEPDLAEDVGDIATSLVRPMVDPFQRKLPYGLLDVHVQVVRADDVYHVFEVALEQVDVPLSYLWKIGNFEIIKTDLV